MSIEQCTRDFERLHIRSGLEEEPEQTVAWFLRGHEIGITKNAELQPYWTFDNVCKMSIKVQKHFKNKISFSLSYSCPSTQA